MDVNQDSPWNPRVPADILPADFERLVLEWLRRTGDQQHQTIASQHLGTVKGEGGQYKIDVLVTFSAFRGALFVVLVECKHQARPVERDDVMVLESKLRDVNAQKAMLFSTSGFQSGALAFATAKKIATIAVVEGDWLYETRAAGAKPRKPPPWAKRDRFSGIWMNKTPTGVTCSAVEFERLDAIGEWLAGSESESQRT